ncbi:MAG: putative bifunctional diguanylate cyclase/phosphodiesterase [Janthinobacterium lividum]
MSKEQKSILLVDDEQLNLDMLSRRLTRSGFHVLLAKDGYAALELTEQHAFDLVLLDHMMPGISGPQVLQQLREKYTATELPVIMVTAIAESDKIADALGAGANDYITKPIDYQVALARIQVQIGRRETELALRNSEQRYALALKASRDALWDWNLLTDSLFYSPRWMEMLGLGTDTVNSSPRLWFDHVFQPDLANLQGEIEHARQGIDPFECEYRVVDKRGDLRWMISRAVLTQDAAGNAIRLSGSQSDVTEERTRDNLTGLSNRLALVGRLEQLFHLAQQPSSSTSYALLFLDLDGFKTVNDSLGHPAGDQLLCTIAQRLRQAVAAIRSSQEEDLPANRFLVARMGGDEFAVLVVSSTPLEIASRLAKCVQELMLQPAVLDERSVHCAFSIGVAQSSTEHKAAEAILRDADTAMYAAKSSGRGMMLTFTPEMRQTALSRMELENDLCDATEKGEMCVLYQPKVKLDTGAVYGVEALVRWHHPVRGLLPPSMFIPIAEKTGAILEIGNWVLRTACKQVKQWQDRYPAHAALEVSVNLSPCEFRSDTLVTDIQSVLEETGYLPHLLHLEITEGVLFDDIESARRVLNALHRFGILLDLDDFGSGFSSLRYLRELPFDILKIDRYFISALDSGSASSAELIRTMLSMAKNLELEVVAEGIETKPHNTALQQLGCRYGQGFYHSRPLTAEAMEALLCDTQAATATENMGEQPDKFPFAMHLREAW